MGPFADLADPSKDRLFLSFCTENTNADYAKVEDITYSNKNLTFIFKDGTTRLDIKKYPIIF